MLKKIKRIAEGKLTVAFGKFPNSIFFDKGKEKRAIWIRVKQRRNESGVLLCFFFLVLVFSIFIARYLSQN